jgi:hypothetical protein
MASSVALAGAPATGSLPGGFTTNIAGTTYTGTGSTATIAIGGTAAPTTASVIQFGGTALGNSVSPVDTSSTTGAALAAASNPGFSIGSGATLNITNGGAAQPTLVNDESGNPSQIYGALNAGSLGGPLFVANASGVVVGAGGTITTPATGVGLLGFGADSNAFATSGTLTVNSATTSGGDVTVAAGSTISGSTLLVAGNAAVNVGIGGPVDVVAGYGFSTSATTVAPTASTALPNSTATANFSGGSTATPIAVAALYAAGDVNNSGILALPATGYNIGGTFTNTGVANVAGLTAGAISNAGVINDTAGTLTAVGTTGATSGANITNTGVINETASFLTATAGTSGTTGIAGNFSNTGMINFTTAAAPGTDSLYVYAQNINMGGSIQATPAGATKAAPLSSTNYLSNIYLYGGYAQPSTTSNYTGVVDIASSIYSRSARIRTGAARILSGGLYGEGTDSYAYFDLGNGQFTDPFTSSTLSYNLSLFPKTTVDYGDIGVYGSGQPTGSPNPNINLDGILSTQTQATGSQYNSVSVTSVHNINGSGGFALANNGFLYIDNLTGNINNPNGGATVGSTAFQYNNVPVNVGNTSTGTAGTANIYFEGTGPSASSGTPQNINFLVNGNANLYNVTSSSTAPTLPVTPATSYTNNHLVVQATGNINVGADGTITTQAFYWPGLVYLNTVTSASNPLAVSSAGSITLDGNLNNVIPAVVSSGGGIFFETNNLNLNGYTVTTNTNSWVNFATPQIASAFAITSSASFFDAYLQQVTSTVSQLNVQALPTSDYQPAN